jgi:autotransporter-associated beta strand protein
MAVQSKHLNKFRNSLLAGTAALAIATVLPGKAAATSATWLANPGTGVWNTGGNWTGSTAPVNSGDTATFGASSQTSVTLSANTTVSVLNFGASAPAYTITDTAHAFTIDGAGGTPGFTNTSGNIQTFTINGGSLATLGGGGSTVDIGTSDFEMSGSGSGIVFAAGSTSTGGHIGLASGTSLTVTGTGTLGTAVVASSGGTINISGASGGVSFGNLNDNTSNGETINLGANTLTLGSANLSGGYNGVISGTGGITKVGTGTLTLSAANTYSGATTLTGGTLFFSNANALGTGSVVLNGGTLGFSNLTLANAITLNNTVNTINAVGQTDTLTGLISGTGGLNYSAGFYNLNNAGNTYSGGSTLAGGVTLTVANAAALGSGAVTLASGTPNVLALTGNTTVSQAIALTGTGSTLTVNTNANTDTMSGVISGAGGLTKTGSGNLIVTGTSNTFTGGLTLTSGSVTLGANNALGPNGSAGAISLAAGTLLSLNGYSQSASTLSGSGALDLGTGGSLSVYAQSYASYTGAVTGTGNLTILGSGPVSNPVTLRNLNPGTVYAGITSLSNTNAIVSTNAAIGTGGLVSAANTSNALALTNNINITQPLTLSSGSVLALNTTGTSTLTGPVSGSGTLTTGGTGTLILDTTSTATGLTTVSGGELIVGDASHPTAALGGSAVVTSGAILRGHGQVNGSVSSTGTVEPGASIGTLTVNGNYTQATSGSLAIELNPTVTSLLAVNGSAALAGNLTLLPDAGVYTPYTRYTVLTATNGVTGTFGNVTDLAPNLTTFSVSYQPNGVTVTTLPSYTFAAQQAALGAGRNNVQVAGALDRAYPTASGSFQSALNNIYFTSPQQQQQTFNQLSGEMRSNFATINVANTTALHDTLLSRLDSRAGLTTAAANGMPNQFQVAAQTVDDMGPLYNTPGKPLPMVSNDTVSTWVRGFGNFGDAGSYQGSTPFQYQTGGIVAGADKQVSDDTLAGLAVAYDHTNIGSGLDESGNIDSYRIMVYGDQKAGPVMLDGSAGYGYSTYKDERSLVFPGTSQMASSNHDGNDYTADLGLSHTFKDVDTAHMLPGTLALQPRVGGEYIHVDQGNAAEANGGALGLASASKDLNAWRSTLGGKAVLTLPATERGTVFAPELHLAWQHDFGDVNQVVTQTFIAAPATPFTVVGVHPGRDAALVGAGLTVAFDPQSSLFANYDGAIRNRETDQTISAGFKYKW